MSSTDFKMTTEKKILKKKILKKKIHKKKILTINKKKKEEEEGGNGFWYYNKFDYNFPEGSKSTNNNPEKKMMTEQQKQTEISRRVKNYWLREKKNKLVCLIGISQTKKEAHDEASIDDVGDMNHIPTMISLFRPNRFPEIAHYGGIDPDHFNPQVDIPDPLRPSHIVHMRTSEWADNNEKKIKDKLFKLVRLSLSVDVDNNVSGRIHSNQLAIETPLKKEFNRITIKWDKDIARRSCNKSITHFDVLDWKSSVFSHLKYWKWFCPSKWGGRRESDIKHEEFARLYEGCVNENTKLCFASGDPVLRRRGIWLNPAEYADPYSSPCRQVVQADKIYDEATFLGASCEFEGDLLPHIEIAHPLEKTSKWSSLKWKTVSNYNLIPQMCASLNISITVFKKLYLLMLKDLKKRQFSFNHYNTKSASLWAIFHNKWTKKNTYEKIIYSPSSQGLYLDDAENDDLSRSLTAYSRTKHLNLTFKNEVAGKEYEIDFTQLIVMSMMIGSIGEAHGILYTYARDWNSATTTEEKARICDYKTNSKLYSHLCVLKSEDAFY